MSGDIIPAPLSVSGGAVNAALIGRAFRDSLLFPEQWRDMGDAARLFQYFKQLWHTVGYFG